MNDIGQFDDFAGEITIKADSLALGRGKHYVVAWTTDHMGKRKVYIPEKCNCIVSA